MTQTDPKPPHRITLHKPWLSSTGPRTAAGKAKSGARSTTHGGSTAAVEWAGVYADAVWLALT